VPDKCIGCGKNVMIFLGNNLKLLYNAKKGERIESKLIHVLVKWNDDNKHSDG
jgi:hypothetical protein